MLFVWLTLGGLIEASTPNHTAKHQAPPPHKPRNLYLIFLNLRTGVLDWSVLGILSAAQNSSISKFNPLLSRIVVVRPLDGASLMVFQPFEPK